MFKCRTNTRVTAQVLKKKNRVIFWNPNVAFSPFQQPLNVGHAVGNRRSQYYHEENNSMDRTEPPATCLQAHMASLLSAFTSGCCIIGMPVGSVESGFRQYKCEKMSF